MNEKDNKNKELLEMLNQHKILLNNIDNKSSILLSICSILMVAVTSSLYYIKWFFVLFILLLLAIVLFFLIISIFPRDKNWKYSSTNDSLYFGSINKYIKNNKNIAKNKKITKDDLHFFKNKITDISIIEQLIRICEIISIKYKWQKISIYMLSISIFIFIVFLFINFLIF